MLATRIEGFGFSSELSLFFDHLMFGKYPKNMKLGKDVTAEFKDLYVVHQNIPGKRAEIDGFKEHLLFVPLQGEIQIRTNAETYSVGVGQMLYLPPKTSHSFTSSDRAGERLIAMLDPKAIRLSAQSGVKLPINQLIKEILFYLLLHPKTKNANSLVRVLAETLEEVVEQIPSSGGLDHLEGKIGDPRIKRVLEIMRDSVGERVSLDQIAKEAGLSSRNLTRLVVKETGIQPRQWLINFRIDRSQELLKRPGTSVTEVAMEVGYSSLSQFISAFRSRTGQLPSDFLKRG
ncbi:MAG: helix-turn-helix domain-containing protein [Bdellovibrionaceae bacterium]|nr:helix-turn-helix domain-containing protein [Pseudobdellovibrionaceae bacterium]